MKKYLLIFFGLLSFAQASGQSCGLLLGPNLSFAKYSPTNPDLGYSAGFFYDQMIYKRIGFSTGFQFTKLNYDNESIGCLMIVGADCPNKITVHRSFFEIPLQLTLDITPKSIQNWQFLLASGFSYGHLVNYNSTSYFSDSKEVNSIYSLSSANRRVQSALFGFETKYNLKNNLSISLGGQYKYTYFYHQWTDQTAWNIQIKAGYTFKRK